MSLNIKRKNNFQKSKSSNELITSNLNLNDLFNGKGNIINDELDKYYINHCIKLSGESRFQKSKETERNKLFKRCRICRNFKNNENLIFCSVCKDAFHFHCLDEDEKESETEKSLRKCYECKRCIKSEEEKDKILKYKQLKLDETLFNKNNSNIGGINHNNNLNNNHNVLKESNKMICHKCNKIIKDKSSLSTCEKCKNIFHSLTCFRNIVDTSLNRNGNLKQKKVEHKILCEKCEKIISKEMHTTKISDFFKSKKYIGNKRDLDGKEKAKINNFITHKMSNGDNNNNIVASNSSTGINSETKREIQICVNINKAIDEKQSPEICNVPIRLPRKMPKAIEEKSMKSLFRALEAKGIEFSDDLVYIEKDCPKEMNNSLLENSIQILNDDNKKKYYKFKEKSRKGIYAPVEVVDDPEQRFVVRALNEMVTNTLICEYTGEVSLARNRLFDDNDSIMDLIHSPTSDTSLVICPEKFGNLARFLSGINNKYKLLKKKKNQNVYSLRVNIDGSVHILLLTSKRIKKGEILYYDYNAGGYNTYNTDHFV
jgi:hypothetical protein